MTHRRGCWGRGRELLIFNVQEITSSQIGPTLCCGSNPSRSARLCQGLRAGTTRGDQHIPQGCVLLLVTAKVHYDRMVHSLGANGRET